MITAMSPGIGFVFPGQGSQSVGMGKALYEANPDSRRIYQEASDILGYDVTTLCFEGPAERLNLTEFTQPALLTASLAALRLLDQGGRAPAAVAGHSLGEYSALVAAGGLEFAAALSLVQKRGQYMAEAVPPGTGMVVALLGLPGEDVRDVCARASDSGIVAAANFNSPGQVVIAGEKAAVERAIQLAKEKGCRKAVPLPVSVPVHTPLMSSAAERLAVDMKETKWSDLRIPLVNNVDAKAIRTAAEVRDSLVRQLPSSVRWEESVKVMYEMGVRLFVEVGPGTVLSGLIKRILPDAVTTNVQDPASLEKTLATLSATSSATS